MKRTLALVLLALPLAGCMNTASVVKAMGESNASVSVRIRTVYGSAEIVRLNPSLNTSSHTVGTEGQLTVGAPKTP